MRLIIATLLLILAGGCQENRASDQQIVQGYGALEQKDYDAALAAADQYIKSNPQGTSMAEAMYLRGRVLEQRPKQSDPQFILDFREARASYERALTMNPSPKSEGYIRTQLANACYWLGDYAVAEKQWLAAYERLEDNDLKAWVLYRAGLSQQRQGKFDEADRTFSAVNQRYAGAEAAQRSAAHIGFKAFHVQIGAFKSSRSADELLAKVRKQGYPAVHMTKGDLHLVMAGPYGKYQDALEARNRLLPDYRDAVIVP